MSQIVDDLRQVAIEIKTETQVGGNTAERVGGAFERVADALEGTQQIEDMDAAVTAVQQAAQENEQTIQDIVNNLAVVQTTGQSTSDVMSQKAVTDMFYTPISNIKELPYATLSTGKFGTNANVYHGMIPVIEGEEYYLTKGSAVSGNYCFVTSDSYVSGGNIPLLAGTSVMQIDNGAKVTIPQGCKYMLVYYSASTRPFVLYKKDLGYDDICDIQPLVTFDYIGGLTGDFSVNQNFEDGTRCSTVRYIKRPKDGVIKVSADTTGGFQFYWYDAAFNFMQVHAEGMTYNEPNTFIEITPLINDYTYLKVCFVSNTAFHRTKITLRGRFEHKEYFNIRPNNGYHKICAMVNVSNARCCNDITKDIQDEVDFRPNYGVIALPTTYSATGTPTRMIIYCHGAGTHFTFSNSTTFNTSTHVDPAYWLAEGYAVMDIDGNPMGADAHAFRPQAMSAYIEAYKWAIEHYNICRDGVFLGGRSMGGGNTMYLLRSTCPIPIIAACANLPTSVAMNEASAAKLSIANMRGFVIPGGFTFSDGPMNDADTQVYYDNWDKAIRYIPSIALCVDTPTTEEWRKNFIKNCCHVGEPYESNRIEACKGMHMVVKAPLKMFTCIQDPNNGYQATAQLYMTMLGNAGQQAELRLYNSYKNIDYPSDSRTAHYYELADPTLRTTYTTIFGQTLTNVPKVYIEMLQFWRRFEQGM